MPATVTYLEDLPPRLWLRGFAASGRGRNRSASARLVMVPHAGAGASSFNRWMPLFPNDLEVLRVQLPGREDSRSAARTTSVIAAATTLAGQLLELPELPTVVYGHSMGAVIGFELVRSLAAAGRAPVHLCVSGRRAPHLPSRRPRLHDYDDARLLAVLGELSDTWHLLSSAPEFLRDAMDLVRHDLTIAEGYRYRAGRIAQTDGIVGIPVPITICHGDIDPLVDADEARAWVEHTCCGSAVHTFAGDHFFHQQHRERLVHLLTSAPPAGSDIR